MSYNITDWETKKLDNLVVPFQAFFNNSDWSPEPPPAFDGRTGKPLEEITLNFYEGEIKGKLVNGNLHVSKISISSSHELHHVIKPALRQSTGELVANLTWEGGDAFSKLIVKDGDVQEVNVEW